MNKSIVSKILAVGLLASAQFVFAEEVVVKAPDQAKAEDHQKHEENHHKHGGVWAKAVKAHDGKISKEEWLAIATKEFDKRDLNHDGVVTKQELHQFNKENHEKHEKQHLNVNNYDDP